MSAVLDFAGKIQTETCAMCGIEFGMPLGFMRSRREDKQTFYCPNGHAQHYSRSEADRLKAELEAKEKELARARESAQHARKASDRNWKRFRQAQGRYAAMKTRIANGVCPCCKRTFSNSRLARHIATKHPEFKLPEPEVSP